MKFGIAKFVVLAVIVVLAIVVVNKYTSDKIETGEGGSLEETLTAGLADTPATETEEGWDKPYSKELVERIEEAESGEKKSQEQTEEDRQKMAGDSAQQLFSEEYDIKPRDFPLVEKIALEERTRYKIIFDTDADIRFVVYAEGKYNSWKASGNHVTSKVTTKSGPVCCAKTGEYNIDINDGEGGDYYFVFDGADIASESDLPTQAKIRVVKTGGI